MLTAVDAIIRRLRKAAKVRGWNRFRLAKEAGLGVNAFRNLSSSSFNPRADTLRKVDPVIRRIEASQKKHTTK